MPYAMSSLCRPNDALADANDMDLWLLWTAAEYVLATRDTASSTCRVRFADGGRASLWEHLKRAFAHQESLLGPHGGYLTPGAGDWSDFSTAFLQMTESTLVSAQLAYVYPRAGELADLRGDRAFAARLRAAGARKLADDPARVDRPRLVLARLRRRPPDRQRRDLRRAPAVGAARRAPRGRPGAHAGRQRAPLPDRRRRARVGARAGEDRLGAVARRRATRP